MNKGCEKANLQCYKQIQILDQRNGQILLFFFFLVFFFTFLFSLLFHIVKEYRGTVDIMLDIINYVSPPSQNINVNGDPKLNIITSIQTC